MEVQQETQNIITLKGSVEIVTEFFGFSINSILYQRGIYPPETFTRVSKYGLAMLVTSDDGLKDGVASFLALLLLDWLMKGEVRKLVVVITGVETHEVLERWVFHIDTDKEIMASNGTGTKSKPLKEIMNEIQAIIRQITASVTFLPLLSEPCTFDLLVYTDTEADVPRSWEESDPRYINNSTEVRLRSFTTKVHKVDSMVAYKNPDMDNDI